MFRTYFDSDNKVWFGTKSESLFNRNTSIGQAILWILKRDPSKIAQISENSGVQLTNEELLLSTIRAAQNITKLGVTKGDVIGIVAKSGHNLAAIIFAAMAIGCPINPMDPAYGKAEISHMIGITKPKLIICDQNLVDVVHESLSVSKTSALLYTFDGSTDYSRSVEELLKSTNIEEEFVCPKLDDGTSLAAAIMCSSGTTGLPKGVSCSHAALLDGMLGWTPYLTRNDITFSFSSIHWLTGLGCLIVGTLFGCTRVITTNPFSPELFLRIIETYKTTFVFSPPSQLAISFNHENFKKSNISSIKHYGCGGSILAEDLCKQIREYLPNGNIHNVYGLSELGPISSNYPPKADSVGLLCDRLEAKVIDDDGKRCGVNELGEICLNAPHKFIGYYNNDELTQKAFDADGWFKTGDVGYFDEDGYMFIVDRIKDLMKYCHYRLPPSEIENLLVKHPAVKQACVIAIPDLISTELPAAVIVVNDGCQLTEQEVHQLVAENLSDSRKLRGGVYFVDSLPMTSTGKVVKRLVKDNAIQLYEKRHINNIVG